MAKECLFSSKMSLDNTGQDEDDVMCIDCSRHPFHKRLLSTWCIPAPIAVYQNPIPSGKGDERSAIRTPVLKYRPGSVRKGLLTEESQPLRPSLTGRGGTGSTKMVFLPLPIIIFP